MPIGFAELRAWALMTGVQPSAHEVELIRRLDALSLADPKTWDAADG